MSTGKDEIEVKFHARMLTIYHRAAAECDYRPTYFLRMVHERGGLAAARALLHADKPAAGLTTLWEKRRLDLSVEATVLQEPWASLFTAEERAIAERRLRSHDYSATGGPAEPPGPEPAQAAEAPAAAARRGTLKQRILDLLAKEPDLTDRALTDRLLGPGAQPVAVNMACREMAERGMIARAKPPFGGPIRNRLAGGPQAPKAEPAAATPEDTESLGEDGIKQHVVTWLEAHGWRAEVAWGKAPGTDIVAVRGDARWIIEVKGPGSSNPMRVNYFLAIVGETLQRMDHARAKYSIALPDHPQFRGLWERLPLLAKQRTTITAIFVAGNGVIEESVPPIGPAVP